MSEEKSNEEKTVSNMGRALALCDEIGQTLREAWLHVPGSGTLVTAPSPAFETLPDDPAVPGAKLLPDDGRFTIDGATWTVRGARSLRLGESRRPREVFGTKPGETVEVHEPFTGGASSAIGRVAQSMTPREALAYQRQALDAGADLAAEIRLLRVAFEAADAEASEAMARRSLANKQLQDAFFRFREAHPAPAGFFWESEHDGPKLAPMPGCEAEGSPVPTPAYQTCPACQKTVRTGLHHCPRLPPTDGS